MTEDMCPVEWVLYLNYLMRNAENLEQMVFEQNQKCIVWYSKGIPQHLSEMLFPPELRDLVCLLLAKKRVKRENKKRKACHADFSAPGLDLFTQSSKNNQTNIHTGQEARLPSHARVRPSVWGTQTFASPCPRAIRACRDGHRAFCFRLLQQLAAKWQANEDNPLQALISSQGADDSSKHKDSYGKKRGQFGTILLL